MMRNTLPPLASNDLLCCAQSKDKRRLDPLRYEKIRNPDVQSNEFDDQRVPLRHVRRFVGHRWNKANQIIAYETQEKNRRDECDSEFREQPSLPEEENDCNHVHDRVQATNDSIVNDHGFPKRVIDRRRWISKPHPYITATEGSKNLEHVR